jgi:hypothetical protein
MTVSAEVLGIQGFSINCEVHPQEERDDCRTTGWVGHRAYNFAYLAKGPSGVLYDKFYCERCGKWKSLAYSIGNLKKHVVRAHPAEWTAICQKYGVDSPPGECVLSPEEKKKRICQFIVSNCQAFRTVESPEFQDMTDVRMTRHEVRERVMEMKNDIFLKLKNLLEKATDIAIAFDEWADAANVKYLGVRAYTVVERKYWHVCLEHIVLEPRQSTADELALLIERILKDKYHIREKVHCAVTDNASVMLSTVSKLGVVRMPCFCHVLNLMLTDVISVINIDPLVKFAGSTTNSSRFTAYLKKLGAKYCSIPTYSPTRWFSLWKTVRNCLEDRIAIDSFIAGEKRHNRPVVFIPPDAWDAAEKLQGVLQTFKNACCLLETDHFGSISHIFQAFRLVQESLIGNDVRDPRLKVAWDKALKTHWEKFVTREVRLIVAVAAILNPSVSLTLLSEEDINDAKMRLVEEIGNSNPPGNMDKAKRKEERDSQTGLTLSDIEDDLDDHAPGEIDLILKLDRSTIRRTQREFDLWEWWAGNKATYPALHDIALKYLAIPASSAAAERQFSKAKMIQGKKRQSLGTKSFQALVYVSENKRLLLN